MLLKDQPTFKEVAKVFIVGLALRSYMADGDGQQGQQQQRRTCFGHELSRSICLLATSSNRRPLSSTRHRFLKWMSPERLKDYDVRNKQRSIAEQQQQKATEKTECGLESATKSGNNNHSNGGGDAQVATLKHN